jgi:hypothetical protein
MVIMSEEPDPTSRTPSPTGSPGWALRASQQPLELIAGIRRPR